MNYLVIGGIYTDLTFTTLEPGTAETYGPFDTYEAAYTRWIETSRIKVDTATHRMVIRQLPSLPSLPPMDALAALQDR